ncbi:MAG: hypothetical protein L6Q26_02820 [Anaerolineales bacterium]|nr:hypothetical protein [Anaerolineales bacterium]NUQ84997.1 hypothetical protein [Anaerolineales bacterium]
MIDEILDFARSETGRLKLDLQPVDASASVREVRTKPAFTRRLTQMYEGNIRADDAPRKSDRPRIESCSMKPSRTPAF